MGTPAVDYGLIFFGLGALAWHYLGGPTKTTASSTSLGPKASKGELACKFYLEKVFKQPFQKIRPNWLVFPDTGRPLELDMYCAPLKLACEYQGPQHYQFTPAFHKAPKEWKAQVKRDQYKAKRCHELGITLLTVPYTVKPMNIPKYLGDRLILIHKAQIASKVRSES